VPGFACGKSELPPSLEGWNFHDEWVYNGADLEHDPVIFAHFRDDTENRKLMAEYGGHRAWLLTLGPESSAVVLKTYPSPFSLRGHR